VSYALSAGVQLRSNSGSILFDAVKGTVTPTATLRVTSSVGALHQVVNLMGRVRTCSPDGALAGYARC
jgi:type IV fimbrial biogenesis protein FimT